MSKRMSLMTLISAALAAGTISTAHAQAAAPAPGAQAGAAFHQSRAFGLPGERVDARLAYLKAALKVTPAQEPQWTAFADTMRKQARAQDEQIKTMRARFAEGKTGERPNAIARLEWQQKFHAETAARLEELLAVERPLYAALSPDQQRVADELLAPRGGDHGFGRRGGPGRG